MNRTTIRPILCAMLIMVAATASAQTMADVLNDRTNVTFIGLDFSEARFVPTIDFAEVDAAPGLALLKWNNLLEQEPEKFNMGKALDISRATTNTSFVREVNEGLTSSDLLARDPYELDPAKIPAMVKAYKTSGDGVGVVLIVSTFNKTEGQAVFQMVFFNMVTKEILLSQRVVGKPMGFGTRNYWAGAVYGVLKDIRSTYAKAWHKQYK